jgi:TonB-linked SusC/RagA family outer membrane protein
MKNPLPPWLVSLPLALVLAICQLQVFAQAYANGFPKSEGLRQQALREAVPLQHEEYKPDFAVSGNVRDESGNPLPGVNVILKGTTTGTTTDRDGKYALSVPDGEGILIFSFIGYKTHEVPINNRMVMDIALVPDVMSLQEVVVVGYGSVKKQDLTGAVATVGNEDIARIGTTNPIAALQGQVAGVNITANTGLVGGDYEIQIRGVNSLTGGKPLFVVDGVMTDNIDFLNPHDIERIDILKDASSTAIYGSRGSNGVIIVTTKSGKGMKGRVGIAYSGFVGMRTFSNLPDFLDAEQAVLWTKDRQITRHLVRGEPVPLNDDLIGFPTSPEVRPFYENVIRNKNYYDWVGETMKPSIQTNHFISAFGGNENISYVVGGGYQGDNGNIEGQTYKKYNFKGSVDATVSDQWAIGTNINLAHSERELGSGNAMRQLFRMPPFSPAYDENGDIIRQPMPGISGNVSPLAELKYNKHNTQAYYLISNFYLEYKPVQWISLKSTFSPNIRYERFGEYWDPLATGSSGGGQMSTSTDFSYIWDNQLRIGKEFNAHRIDYDFVYSVQYDRFEYLYGFGWGLPFNSEFYNLGSAPQTGLNTSSSYEQSSLMSFTNRLNYGFLDKYLLTATARWDGSSRLAPGNKWAFFPSAAIAWKLSEESFIENISAVSSLKLRLSYGYTGNDNISPYETQFAVSTQTYYDWDGKVANGFRPSAIANKDLTWERTREWNLGLDFGFKNDRITGEVNVYDKLSLQLLMRRKLAVPTGWGEMWDNVGSLSNKGVEVQLKTVNIKTKNFTWETNFTFSANKNAIVELYGKKEDDVPNRWFIGQPAEVVYAMVFDGIWQKDELAEMSEEDQLELEGTAKVKDLNNDGTIDIDNDMAILGSPIPNWIGSVSTTLNFKNWDMSATLYTKQGVFLYSPFHTEFTDMNSKLILDVPYYMRDNPLTESRYSNTYPQPRYQGAYWGEDAEDFGYPGFNKDASFVRLQNVSLGYNLNPDVLNKVGIRDMRLYVNVLNPFVWTSYDGFDPEWAGANLSGESANSTSFTIYQLGTNIKF